VDLCHAVREVEAVETGGVEDVRICTTAAERIARLEACSAKGPRGELDDRIALPEAVAGESSSSRPTRLAFGEARREGRGLEHLPNELGDFPLVVRAKASTSVDDATPEYA
jgi:hypothetical protein